MRCSEPRPALRPTFCVFAICPSAAWHALQGSRSLILCLVRPMTRSLIWFYPLFVLASCSIAPIPYPWCGFALPLPQCCS
jgi:hypothetical protein